MTIGPPPTLPVPGSLEPAFDHGTPGVLVIVPQRHIDALPPEGRSVQRFGVDRAPPNVPEGSGYLTIGGGLGGVLSSWMQDDRSKVSA